MGRKQLKIKTPTANVYCNGRHVKEECMALLGDFHRDTLAFSCTVGHQGLEDLLATKLLPLVLADRILSRCAKGSNSLLNQSHISKSFQCSIIFLNICKCMYLFLHIATG